MHKNGVLINAKFGDYLIKPPIVSAGFCFDEFLNNDKIVAVLLEISAVIVTFEFESETVALFVRK